MGDIAPGNEEGLAAGDFLAWVVGMQRAIQGDGESDVPCAGCTACCTASQFVHIARDESETLAHIPAELLFPAPRLPRGHMLLGYDERGHCPMLVDGQCSIYEHRPRACRTYDCRIFPATGIDIGDDAKALIAQRARQWKFRYPSQADVIEQASVRAAATYLDEHRGLLSDTANSMDQTQLAVLAVAVHELFPARQVASGQIEVESPDPAAIRTEVTLRTRSRHTA